MIDWQTLTPEAFEQLCAELLELNGFDNIEWYGKGGGDKGRDLVAVKYETPLPGVRRARKWVVQCKRYTQKSLGKNELTTLFNAAREHSPDVVLVLATTTLTSDVRDWLKAVQPDYRFDVFVWEERDLERQVGRHRSKLSTQVTVIPKSAEPTWFYPAPDPGKVYMSGFNSPFEEVGFYLLNSYGTERDHEILCDFVEFIRHNEIAFSDGESDE